MTRFRYRPERSHLGTIYRPVATVIVEHKRIVIELPLYIRINNYIQASLALAYNLGVGSDNTPWSLPGAAKEIGVTFDANLLARANRLIR